MENKIGIKKESKAIELLRSYGIEVEDIKTKAAIFKCKISDYESEASHRSDEEICIKLCGRPDGIIKKICGNVYNEDTIIEIKYRNNATLSIKDKLQICGYSVIFSTDILSVIIDGNNNLYCELFSKMRLKKLWNMYKKQIFTNCIKLEKLFWDMENDSELKKLLSLTNGLGRA